MNTKSTTDVATIDAPVASSRRHMLRLAGAAAVGAAAVAVAGTTGTASADNGISLLGAANTTADETRVNYTGAGINQSGFVFQSGSIYTANSSNFPAALAGFSGEGSTPKNGVYGYADSPGSFGVVGDNGNTTGVGVKGRATVGTGVYGEGEVGVRADGVNTGLNATASNGNAIIATSSDANSFGVLAVGAGGGVYAASGGPFAISAGASGRANLFLQPNNNFLGISPPKTVPTTRTDDHLAGEVECVGGDLWFCIKDGTPGTWRRLAGAGIGTGFNAGFNAVTPGRLYDSRMMTPSGPLAAGATRDLILRNRVDAVTFAVNAADYVRAGATALACNVTVVNTVGSGFLAVNPLADTIVHAATINWSAAGQILNNGVNITLGGDRQVTVVAGGSNGASTDFVIDVTGYYL